MLEELRTFSPNARLFLLSNGIFSFSSGVFYLVYNIYVVEGLKYSEYFLGILLSASSFAAAFFSLPSGILGDRVGRKKCLVIGEVVAFLSLGLLTVAHMQNVLIFANAVAGLSITLTYVSFAPFMMENTSEKERVHLFSVNGAVGTLGLTGGTLIGGRLPLWFSLPYADALQATLLVAVFLSGVSVVPLLFLTEKKKEPLFEKRIVESTSLMWKFLLTQVLMGFGAGLIVPFFNVFFRVKLHASIETIGIVFALGDVAIGVATFLAAPMASRWGKVRCVVVTEAGSLPFLLMMAYSPHLYLATIGYIMRAALMNMGAPIGSAFMMEHVKEEERATINGIIMGGWNGSWACSNIVAGMLMSRSLYEVPFLMTCILYAGSSLLYYIYFASLEKSKV